MRMPKTAARLAASGATADGTASDASAAGAAHVNGHGPVVSPASGGGTASGATATGSSVPETGAGTAHRFVGLLGRNWLATVLLLAGLALRVIAQVAYNPALVYIDSVKYLYAAWPQADPVGYDAPLKAILAVGNLNAVEVVQHLLGLGMALTLYIVLLRRGVPRWLSALAMAPILLDGYQLNMESTIMPDVWLEAVIVAGLAVLLWKSRLSLRMCLVASVILGTAATVRQIGESLIVPLAIFVVAAVLVAVGARGWKQVIGKLAAAVVAFALPIVAYSAGSYALNGHFWLSRNGDAATYGRMAALADCATLKLPADERGLCPTPKQQAMGPDWLDHGLNSPLRTYVGPVGADRTKIIGKFNKAVVTQQPLRVLGRISSDAAKLFAVTRVTSPGDTPIYRWQFQNGYPVLLPTILHNNQGTIIFALKLNGGPLVYRKLDASYGGNIHVWKPGASFLRHYQLDGGYTPGPLLLLCLIAGLLGGLTIFRRRASSEQRQLALGALLFVTSAVAVLLLSDLFEFSWRYQLPALVTLPPAGAFGIAAMLRFARRRRAARTTGSAQEQRVAARAG